MKRLACAAVLFALLAAAAAEPPAAERARIRAERAQAERRYAEAERDCRTRFVVTSCVEDAREQRRQTLTRLRAEELVLDRAERQQRAAERAAAIRGKQSRDDVPRKPRLIDVPALAASAPPPRLRLRPPPAPRGGATTTPEARQRAAAAYEERQRAAQAHREAVERRNAERQAKAKKPSQPLPLPMPPTAAGSAPAR